MSEHDPINKEAKRRYAQHERLAKKAGTVYLRSMFSVDRVGRAEFGYHEGKAGYTPERVEKAKHKLAIAEDKVGLADGVVELQADRSRQWANENHDQLVEVAKLSAKAAGVEVIMAEDHQQSKV